MCDFQIALGDLPFPECRLKSRHINIQKTDTESFGLLTIMRLCVIRFVGADDTLKDSLLVRATRLMAHANVPSRTLRPEAIG